VLTRKGSTCSCSSSSACCAALLAGPVPGVSAPVDVDCPVAVRTPDASRPAVSVMAPCGSGPLAGVVWAVPLSAARCRRSDAAIARNRGDGSATAVCWATHAKRLEATPVNTHRAADTPFPASSATLSCRGAHRTQAAQHNASPSARHTTQPRPASTQSRQLAISLDQPWWRGAARSHATRPRRLGPASAAAALPRLRLLQVRVHILAHATNYPLVHMPY
jgi:hypothetical protein